MVLAVAPKVSGKITEKESLQLTRNLLRIAVFNIAYIRGLFPDKFFDDKFVPALEMKIKRLMPVDAESKRLLDWMEQGVYDALKRKYLRTMVFAICEPEGSSLLEEYSFHFSYAEAGEVGLDVTTSGLGGAGSQTIKGFGAHEASTAQMKSSACKLVRTLVQLMRTLEQVPGERTIVVKLLYYDEKTPENYEPPFFRSCDEQDQLVWPLPPLKVKVGEVDSKHYQISLKVRSILDPCAEHEEQHGSQDNVSSSNSEDTATSDKSDSEMGVGCMKAGDKGVPNIEKTKVDVKPREEVLRNIRDWLSSRVVDSVDTMDVLARFADVSLILIEEILEELCAQHVLKKDGPDVYTILRDIEKQKAHAAHDSCFRSVIKPPEVDEKEAQDQTEVQLYDKALEYVLPLSYLTVHGLQGAIGSVHGHHTKDLIERMAEEGYIERVATNKKKGRKVLLHKKKDVPAKGTVKNDTAADAHTEAPGKHLISTAAQVQSLGSELTSSAPAQTASPLNGSCFKEPLPPSAKMESKVLARTAAPEISSTCPQTKSNTVLSCTTFGELDFGKDSQDPMNVSDKIRKASMVVVPIRQKKQKLLPEQ